MSMKITKEVKSVDILYSGKGRKHVKFKHLILQIKKTDPFDKHVMCK